MLWWEWWDLLDDMGTSGGVAAITSAQNAIVDAAGDGDYTTLQDAEDAVASTGCFIWVKSGSYTGATLAKNCTWLFEPACTVTGEIQVDTAKVTILWGPGCDIQNIFDWNADGGYLQTHNGGLFDGIDSAGADFMLKGGGYGDHVDGGTARDAVVFTGNDNIADSAQLDTTTSGATTFKAFEGNGDRFLLSNIKATDSGGDNLRNEDGSDYGLYLGCNVLDADNAAYNIRGIVSRAFGNKGIGGTNGLQFADTADNSVGVANIMNPGSGAPFDITAGAENSLLAGCRSDGAIVDSSGTSTTGAIDEDTF
jgi:hypothetical protein